MFNLTFDTTKGFNIWTDRTSHLLYCPKPVCELSFSRFLPSAVLCWCWGRSLICRYNHNTHNLAFCIFLCWTFNNFNKLWIVIVINNEKQIDHISKIMSKSHGIFTENFTVFWGFFSNGGETRSVLETEFDKFYKKIFLKWYKCNIYIVTTSALNFKNLYIFYIFYPIKRIYLSDRIRYLVQTFNFSSQK